MAWPKALQKAVGRDQGPQLWFSQTFTPVNSGTVTVQSQQAADLSRPSEGVLIIVRYRATIGVAAYASLNAETPQNLLGAIRLYGNNGRTGNTVPFAGSGATLFALDSMFDTSGTGGKQWISNTTSTGFWRQPRITSPMGMTIGTAVGNFGGVSSYDVETHYYIPFGPFGGTPLQGLLFSQRDADWNRTMNIQLTFGGNLTASTDNFGVKGSSGTLALTAYGSGSGSPSVNVYLIPTLQQSATGAVVTQYASGVIQRNAQSPATAPTANATNSQIALLQNYDTPNIVVKTGVVTTLGDYSSLSDSIFTKLYNTVGGKPVVQLNDEYSQKDWYEQKTQGLFPQGYTALNWVGAGFRMNWARVFRAPTAGTQWILAADISGASNQQAEIIQEQVLVEPSVVNSVAGSTPSQ
jgi:hypothetical protein